MSSALSFDIWLLCLISWWLEMDDIDSHESEWKINIPKHFSHPFHLSTKFFGWTLKKSLVPERESSVVLLNIQFVWLRLKTKVERQFSSRNLWLLVVSLFVATHLCHLIQIFPWLIRKWQDLFFSRKLYIYLYISLSPFLLSPTPHTQAHVSSKGKNAETIFR